MSHNKLCINGIVTPKGPEGNESLITLLVYIARHDGYQEFLCVPEAEVEEKGGVAPLEAELRENAAWFYPIGKIKGHQDEHGGCFIPLKPIAELEKAWQKVGSPKVIGMAGKKSPLIQ